KDWRRSAVISFMTVGFRRVSSCLNSGRVRCPGFSVPRPELPVPKTVNRVIVHHPRRLHERITDGSSDEAEAALLEILAHRIGLRRAGCDIPELANGVHPRLPTHELPDIRVERASFLLHREKRRRVGDR